MNNSPQVSSFRSESKNNISNWNLSKLKFKDETAEEEKKSISLKFRAAESDP